MESQLGIGGRVKALLRRAVPGAYDALVVWRRGPAMRKLAGVRSRLRVRKILRSRRSFRIDIYGRMGLGATLTNLLILHNRFAAEPGFRGILSSNPLYMPEGSSRDVIDSFFDRLDVDGNCALWDQKCETIPYGHELDISTHELADGLTIQEAHRLFNQHYAVKQRFIDEAKSLLKSRGDEVIGVHFRGSDKRMEARRIPWETYAAAVDDCVGRFNASSVFVATDEAGFLEFMEQRYGAGMVWALDCQYLADGPIPAHFLEGNGFEKGREALVTMLILSMCNRCIRGPSNLSAFAKILNPALPIVMLGEPYPPIPFPEKEILSHAAVAG
jgi:hypothetical protein